MLGRDAVDVAEKSDRPVTRRCSAENNVRYAVLRCSSVHELQDGPPVWMRNDTEVAARVANSAAVNRAIAEIIAERIARYAPIAAGMFVGVGAVQAFAAVPPVSWIPVLLSGLQAFLLWGEAELVRHRWFRDRAVAMGLVVGVAVNALLVVGSWWTELPLLAVLVVTAFSLTAAAVLPWGLVPQSLLAGSSVAAVVAVFAVTVGVGELFKPHGVFALLAQIVSLRVAVETRKTHALAVEASLLAEATGALYREVVEAAVEAIYRTDINGRIVFANAAAEHFFGLKREELVRRHLWELVVPRAREQVRAYYAEQYRNRTPVTFREIPVLDAAGGEKWVSQTVQLWGSGSHVKGFHAVARDITDRIRIVEQLRQSEARFRSTFERAPIGIALVAPDGRFLRVNAALCRMLGYSAEELLERDFQSLTYPDDLGPDLVLVEECLAGARDTYEMEKRYIRRDGCLVTARLLVGLVRDSKGMPVHFVSLIEDVTERRAMEQALRESEERFRSVAEAAFDPIVVTDAAGTVLFWNGAAEQLFGFPRSEACGRSVGELLDIQSPGGSSEGQFLEVVRQCAQERSGLRRELWLRSRGSGEIPVEVSLSVIGADEQKRVVGILRDVRAYKELQWHLQRAKDAAEEATRAKTMFLANMSHEIRTPLAGVLGALDLLRDTALDGEQKEYVETAVASGQALLGLLNDLLDLSKIETGKLEFRREPLDCRALLTEVGQMFAVRARSQGLSFEIAVHPQVPQWVIADRARVRQILVNLVGNALKFTPAGFVRVELSAHRSHVDTSALCQLHFSVRDSGPGIAAADLERIFAPFERGRSEDGPSGAGLGLAIARRLAEDMGGRLWAESSEGQGSTFHLLLPVDLPIPTAARAAEPVRPAEGRRSLPPPPWRILVAEDHPVNQVLLRRILERRGHEVAVASDGQEALRLLEAQRFDLLLADVQMPKLGGLQLIEQVRAREQAGQSFARQGNCLSIVAVTAHALREDRDRCLAAGADAYLCKPISAEGLLRTLHGLVAPTSPEAAATKETAPPALDGPTSARAL